MIRRIGVIYQDANSFGFLLGLRDRLQCSADLIRPATAIGKTQRITRRGAVLALRYFRGQGVDLIVRFTDADGDPWREIQKREMGVLEEKAPCLRICAVAVDNVEDWLCLDRPYLAESLQVSESELGNLQNRTGVIKRAIAEQARQGERKSEVVARIVREAPPEVFRRWLADPALRSFYSDCRAAASGADCQTPNELETENDAG